MWIDTVSKHTNGKMQLHPSRASAEFGRENLPHIRGTAIPAAVIPLDDVEALVEKATRSYVDFPWSPGARQSDRMRHALAAIGVLPRARTVIK